MPMKNLFFSLCLVLWITSCQNQTSTTEVTEEIVTQEIDSSTAYTQDDQDNIVRLIQLTLKDQFKDDLEKGWLDTLSRQFKYEQYDINGDGKKEIFVGLTGPYFCGSGGCTMFLLTHHGDVLTKFTVVEYPVYISSEVSDGWSELILYSGSEYRRAGYDGQSYPSNPSTLAVYTNNVDKLPKILDWQKLEVIEF